jgi:methylamine dehydrogenase accessory protein MauD
MKIWLIINSVGLFITASMLYLTIRQVGLILGRVGPVGARSSESVGPRVGENLTPLIDSIDIPGRNGKPVLLILGNNGCGVCAKIRRDVDSLASYWASKADIVLIYDQLPPGAKNEKDNGGKVPIIRSDMRTKVGVGFVPFGVIVDPAGVVLGKGLVNEMSHIESLLELTQKK